MTLFFFFDKYKLMVKTTPLMEQYEAIKSAHRDRIVFFRMGDFFEMFNEDAEKAAPILNITLTYRNKKSGLKTKMCGVPHHSISKPISKLLSAGLSVAICDQMEPAQSGRGLVRRAVTRVLSPGMVYDIESLDKLTANYMSAFDKEHISFLDFSTGSAFYYKISGKSDVFKLLNQFEPKELVLVSSQKEKYKHSPFFHSLALNIFDKKISSEEEEVFFNNYERYKEYPESAKRLLYYIYCMQGQTSLRLFRSFQKHSLNKEMFYSERLYSHLEIFKNYEGSSKDSLFSAICRTKTAHGARLLKRRLQSPSIDRDVINTRLDAIDFWMARPALMKSVRELLSQMGDGERLLGQLIQVHSHGRNLLDLAYFLEAGLAVEKQLYPDQGLSLELKKADLLSNKIKHVLSPSCPASLKEGGFVNKGVNPQLDEWMDFTNNSQKKLLDMEQRERQKLGIPSLKIRYNSVFGYYIEVRKIHSSKIPSSYRRKQTLVSAERYTMEELNLLEEKILTARSKQIEMEQQIFQDLKSELLIETGALLKLCFRWAEVDVYSALAFLALERKYVRPQFKDHFKLSASRHPVLEQKTFHKFVPNDIELSREKSLILTGPNMAGKSTLMRQAALTVLLAQSACFVPAEHAELPIFHKMFTRIGASDSLSQGLSTFMLEMKETAEILEKADSKSFIVLDELGRGTSTFDGMSLAQSVIEFLTMERKSYVLFATHYQELIPLADQYPSIGNASMSIREEQGQIRFLYFLKKGASNKSYGIHVARLAGLPEEVINRARSLLKKHESLSQKKELPKQEFDSKRILKKKDEKELYKSLMKEVADYPLMTRSPIDATNQIARWQKQIKTSEKNEKDTVKTESYSLFDEENHLKNLN